ncbi:calcium/sodium antiporter [Prosthecobacter sp.]|jgi:cation:H+ antiporter|uniref:calcium/sodium antiporter n=1 Tax=Prosthecobacter sp. TaxID=1965333 RepID=UPI003783ED17
MQNSLLLLLAGVLLAWFGGEFFVKGGVGLARWLRWPSAVIGVTVAAFGTSSPELFVAIHAALEGLPQISLGDVLGSNVANVSLVLAIVLALSGMRVEDDGVRRDWFMSLLVPGLVYALLYDGWFSRLDAVIMISVFVAWLCLVVRHARRHAAALQESGEPVSPGKTIFVLVLGLGLLICAAQFVVRGGKGVAEALGWSPFVVGAVVVAAATSTPELATTLIARMRGHHDVGLGNILGSNIFNVVFIAAVAAFIQPYEVKAPEVLPSLVFGIVTTLMILPGKGGSLGRWRGFVLLALYAVYVAMTLNAGGAAH